MIHGYHLIWSTYGFWLPNDPRGSWSDLVHAWELARFGAARKSIERLEIEPGELARWKAEASKSLKHPPVSMTGAQALAAAEGIRSFCEKSGLTLWAFSILPEHVHAVAARHRYKIEQAVNLMKGATTTRLTEIGAHPMAAYKTDGKLPSMWSEGQWKVYLDSEESIDNAINYVEFNPEREGKPKQTWSFVRPFEGIPKGGWTTYH